MWSGHVWRIEQTLLALAASRDGVDLLPEREYRISLAEGTQGCVVKHYVGAVRHLMYREGMARLVREGFLEQLGTHNGKELHTMTASVEQIRREAAAFEPTMLPCDTPSLR